MEMAFASGITLTEAELQQFENESQQQDNDSGLRQFMAFVPLILVAVMNKYLSTAIKTWYPNGFDFNALGLANYTVDVAKTSAIWAVGLALIVGIVTAIMFDYRRVSTSFKEGVNASIGGSLLAVMNTASEYGFGAIIAALPGFCRNQPCFRSYIYQSTSQWCSHHNRFGRDYRFSIWRYEYCPQCHG